MTLHTATSLSLDPPRNRVWVGTLACIDLEHMLLPKRIVYPSLLMVGGLLVLACAMTSEWDRLLVAGIFAVVWFAVFFVMNFASPRALGFGDVRSAPVLGFGWLGWRYVVLGFFSAKLHRYGDRHDAHRHEAHQPAPAGSLRRLPGHGRGAGNHRGVRTTGAVQVTLSQPHLNLSSVLRACKYAMTSLRSSKLNRGLHTWFD